MDVMDARRIQTTEAPFEIVAWLDLRDDKIVIQTFNGKRRLNWVFNLALTLDRDILRKGLKVEPSAPILMVLNGCVGKNFPPQDYYKSY